LHVAPADGLHELGGSGLGLGRDQQVDVVGHQDISVNDTVPIGSRFSQPVEVTVVVLLGKKAEFSVDAALDNVPGYSG